MAMNEEQLSVLKRPDLQKLAKRFGIKANKKNAIIIKDLMKYFHENSTTQLSKESESEIIFNGCCKDMTLSIDNQFSLPCEEETARAVNLGPVDQSAVEKNAVQASAVNAPATKIPKPIIGIKKDKKLLNFEHIHQKNFKRMESIDDYVVKKRLRANQLKFSLKAAASNAVEVLTSMKQSHNTPNATKDKKSTRTPRISFNMKNVNAKIDSWHTERTASRKTMFEFRSPVPKLNFHKESSATKRFDLKESLKKPLSYKPHRGKLRGLDQTYIHKDKNVEDRKIGVKSMARSKINKMEQRRASIKNYRKTANEKILERRRGLRV